MYKTTIGLEVHAELRTKSKMFCGCKNDPHAGEPNAYTCPVCLAHPGSLPVPNEEAIAKVLLFGEAVGATRATYSEFDRKNYFYPDIPKAYQISQYAFPFLTAGELCGVALTRVHLEEDTARSQHDHDGVSLVDFNRAGVPLMELVTEPVIHDAKTAGDFARELQLLLRTLGISDANMEKGEMRVEANISISSTDELGTKVEVKNLNSFRSVEGAIAYEIERQRELLEKGEAVSQETRGWDEVRLKTFSQRSKETAKDYRYFPDPDIPKINTETYEYFSKARLSEILPELPSNKRINYENIGLPSKQIELLISVQAIDIIFAELYAAYATKNPELLKLAANYLTSDVIALLGTDESAQIALKTENFAELMEMVLGGSINSRVAKDLLTELLFKNESPKAVATAKGLMQSSDPAALASLVAEVITENPTVVAEYLAGKETSIQFLIGQAMKKSRGTANPGVLTPLLKEALEASRKV
ncbi:glutaminyl-tRNA synthase (glutamine-hydrolyzing) subunit B [Candidatus Kaiserbacteria bacterium RIFCSPLOWO2_02_FULL_45_11b]|uniref:Aspartyl/glutamyl-tRNA(Asn/Gln) amidotransferase subunit B n=1 Tax=Candidatus Kaiserbacteria bacterium RIFCSPLOWO2_12_FULL_45_26 TaxID=1798525 RepID=A0A1F6FHU8_9BACT|nr:MAG: glutaminyl-tRNA synthase (glutamine-hydrolyzing) subunit B [Candidatus Kaiserbacteria bacterium RIFCSPLOWO2_02_FULL_45_11b]OGG85429.1 MAG: glutaminyl-tRNA synthase (glutamine-hydrolyzing) subunit B [Candidatus Kaiserbacteria bacterium RIFCSPLOWO2_12_FULL_45_26]